MKEKVIVGLSGGVDSSVAALMLLQQGYQVESLFMFNWAEDEEGYCGAADDFQSARRVAEALDIPLHQADFSAEYRRDVFDYFLAQLEAGFTPNPDMLCNRHIKFDQFLTHAQRLGASHIATGHYANTDNGRLFRAQDLNKDQSYFLALVSSDALKQTLFPLSAVPKPKVRELAAEASLPTFDRPDSTGICFIGERPFADFIRQFLPEMPAGNILDLDSGQVIGRHEGLAGYTLGQRRGLGIGGVQGAREGPWYVVDKDQERNCLLVSQNSEHPRLLSPAIQLEKLHWRRQPESERVLIQYRHRQKALPATLEMHDTGTRIIFEHPAPAVTPGQYAAIYDGDECLGAGEIASRDTLG